MRIPTFHSDEEVINFTKAHLTQQKKYCNNAIAYVSEMSFKNLKGDKLEH